MKLTQRILWLSLTSTLTAFTFAQSEPYYIPNTAPAASDNSAMPAENTISTPSYSTSPESNTGRPASSDTPSSQPLIGAPSAYAPIYSYTQIGTEGLGIGFGLRLNPSWIIRAEANGWNLNHDFTKGNNSYTGKAKLRSEGVYADYYPMGNGFRVTGGLMFNQTKLTADATNAQVNLNGDTYTADAHATVKPSSVMPYLGIGYGHDEAEKPGIKFHADLGVAFGSKPDTSLTLSNVQGNPDAQTLETDRQAEEQNIKDAFKNLKTLPVAKVGVGYTW